LQQTTTEAAYQRNIYFTNIIWLYPIFHACCRLRWYRKSAAGAWLQTSLIRQFPVDWWPRS